MDLIRIRGLEMDCIVGTYPLEREREQRVHLDLAFGLDLAPAGRTGRIALTCDYSEIAEEVMAMLRFRRYHLIEMATEELGAMLLGTHPAMELVDIRLDKPGALDGRARAASVEIERRRPAYPITSRTTAFGSVDTILETREAGIYLFRVKPGGTFQTSPASGQVFLEWLVSGELLRDGTVVDRHVPTPSSDAVATYEGSGDDPAVLFRCICPPGQDA